MLVLDVYQYTLSKFPIRIIRRRQQPERARSWVALALGVTQLQLLVPRRRFPVINGRVP
jgi:hypothetical protein